MAPGGPADRADLRAFARRADGSIVAGDVVTSVDDTPVRSFDDLLEVLERRQAGETVTLGVWRAGATRRVTVRLAESE